MEKFCKRRSGHHSRVKVLIRELETGYLDQSTTEAWVTNQIEEICNQRDLILKLDDSILDECTDMDAEIKKSSETRLLINTAINKAKTWLGQRSSDAQQTALQKSVKLPAIQLRKFSGNPLEWSAFWDIFKSSVHTRGDLSNAAKFYYLSNQLEGDASLLLKDFEHTESCYDNAVDLLIRTYGKPKLLIQARLYALFDLVPPQTNSSEVGRFRSQYEAHLRGLQALGANIKESGYIFSALILRKLPARVQENINRASSSDSWSLDELRSAIEREIELLHAAEEACADSSSSGDNLGGKFESTLCSVNTNNNIVKSARVESNLGCPYCSGKHNAFSCTNYPDSESRKKRVVETGLCFNCLRKNHPVKLCRNSFNCRKCSRRHHTSLCAPVNKVEDLTEVESTSLTIVEKTESVNLTCRSHMLPTATLTVSGCNGTEHKVRCLFDTGSQETCITAELFHKLQLPQCGVKRLRLEGINCQAQSKDYPKLKLSAQSNDGDIAFDAIVVDKLPTNISMPGRDQFLCSLDFAALGPADCELGDVCTNLNLLIGIDNYFKCIYAPKITDGVFMIQSRIGNILAGSIPCHAGAEESVSTVLRVGSVESDDENLNETMSKCWDLDVLGMLDVGESDDDVVERNFNESITYDGCRYTVALPWKVNHPVLPSNYGLARRRLTNTLTKLRENDANLETYHELIQNQLKAGFIELVESPTVAEPSSNVHYLSHRAVFKVSKTTPVRIVFDCSAKCSKVCPSLNECLHSGPSLNNELMTVLQRFRLGRFACVADISKAFLQVGLRECDRDYTRFFFGL